MNLRIKITFETKRLLMMRRHVKIRRWCDKCNAETDFVTEEDFRRLSLKLNRIAQTEDLHRLRTIEGTMLICLESVLKNQT
jgi:hypothetical protein